MAGLVRSRSGQRNVFVLGLDAFNRRELESVRQGRSACFLGLLGRDEVRPSGGHLDFEVLKRKAGARLTGFDETVDAIVSFWDFPSSALASVLRNERGLPGPSNEAVARCEHKYWGRLEQHAVVPELVPPFAAVDPFVADPLMSLELGFPFWLKPVKSHSSFLGFRIENAEDFYRHLPEIRANIGHLGRPFDQFLDHVDVPASVAGVDGHWCIAEGIISAGQQCTLEGYVRGNTVRIYGVMDSVRSGRRRSSFARYQYPARLPRRVTDRMAEAAARVMERIDYHDAPFNMEFYWHRDSDRISLLEVNARISRSHCPLFRMVDGASHQEVMVDLALDRAPDFPHRQGAFRVAAKFMVRVPHSGVVRRVPTAGQQARLQERLPEARLRVLVKEGMRLDRLPYQDSYSFELAEIFLGADSQHALLERYQCCLEMLTFDIEPAAGSALTRRAAGYRRYG